MRAPPGVDDDVRHERVALAQVQDRYAGAFAVDYLERGPEAWRLSSTRVAG